MDYVVVKILSDDLLALGYHGPGSIAMKKTDAVWHVAKANKDHMCAAGWGNIHKGSGCWRPITNGNNRYHRISAAGMAHLMGAYLLAKVAGL